MNKTPVREILAQNLKGLMQRHPTLKKQAQVAARAGIAQTSVSNMLNPSTTAMQSPKLDRVEKVAAAFGLAVWQILLDPKTVGEEMAGMLMRPAVQDDDPRLVNWDASNKRQRPESPDVQDDVSTTPKPRPKPGAERRTKVRSRTS